MKLFNKAKKKEQKENQKKENKVLKFIKDHKVALGYAALLCAAFAGGYISPRRRTHESNDIIDLVNASDTEFGQPRYGIGIDDAFATVLYSDGDVDFVGKDYLMNLAEEIVKQRNNEKEENHEQI